MDSLCFSTNLTSSEMASWVQAIGSIVTIFAGFGVAILQSHQQNKSAISTLKEENKLAKLDIAETLLVLARSSANLTKYYCNKTHDTNNLNKIKNREIYFDTNEIDRLERALQDIPIYTLPHIFVNHILILISSIKQFNENLKFLENNHYALTPYFSDYIKTTNEINISLVSLTQEIDDEIKKIKNA